MKNSSKRGLALVASLPVIVVFSGLRRLSTLAEDLTDDDLVYSQFITWFDRSWIPRLISYIFKYTVDETGVDEFAINFSAWLIIAVIFWFMLFFVL